MVAAEQKPAHGSGRERVLDAYMHLLNSEGAAAATLDEVAQRAEISKGGLLHHFPSKEALTQGLLERLVELNTAEIQQTLSRGEDVIAEYLRSSSRAEDQFSTAFMAVLKLAGSKNPEVDRTLQQVLQSWHEALVQHCHDERMARIVHLMGDGLYLHALVGGAGHSDPLMSEALADYVRSLIQHTET